MSKELFFDMRQQELAHFVTEVENGERDALAAYAEIKKLEKEFASAKKQVEDLALDEAIKFGEKSFEHQGFKFEIRKGATRYSYKNISIWRDKNKELKEIESRAKAAFLAKQKGMLTATDDGEEIELPEVNYSKDSLIVK